MKELYEQAGIGHDFDAAVLERGADGKVKVTDKHEQSTRHGAWSAWRSGRRPRSCRGSAWGGAAVGAGIGAVTGHLKGGMSNDDLGSSAPCWTRARRG